MNGHPLLERLSKFDLVARTGRVRKILPTLIEADGPSVPLGALCNIEGASGFVRAEVVGVRSDAIVLALLEEGVSITFGAQVTATSEGASVPVGSRFLGRAVDALARPIDGLGKILPDAVVPLEDAATTPLARTSPKRVLETGIRAIDTLLTLGHGQRVGIFAPSGAGKTSLMAQLANQVEAACGVMCLVGERGREVEALWSGDLSAPAKSKTTLVAATSDQPAAMRVRAALYALALADHWRAQGKHVLLLLDSVTRLAMAMREIGLAAGEPPTVRAYTPGVFAAIPKLVERCGALRTGGSITAIMTVLAETDDVDDPVSEMMKSLLDGHIILSRDLASRGHYPAIDVPRSISRLASSLRSEQHQAAAQAAAQVLSSFEASRILIESGIYVAGSDADIDRSVSVRPTLMSFLTQRENERTAMPDALGGLASLLEAGG